MNSGFASKDFFLHSFAVKFSFFFFDIRFKIQEDITA